jgi:16S rRNA U516 pseudouridylate synthase RsuA-like enzyme
MSSPKSVVAGKLCGSRESLDHRTRDQHVDVDGETADKGADQSKKGAKYEEVTPSEDIGKSSNNSLRALSVIIGMSLWFQN